MPVDAVTDTLTVSTDSTDNELFREIADGMDVGVKKLCIAYHFNFWAKTDKPRLLNTSKHVKELFDAAHAEMEGHDEAKQKKFQVQAQARPSGYNQRPEVKTGTSEGGEGKGEGKSSA